MEPNREEHRTSFTTEELPGAHTTDKLDATRSTDVRFHLLLAEAAQVGWPRAFCSDLFLHDRETLEQNPDETMIWILRDNGTHLYPVTCQTTGERDYCRAVIEYWSGEDRLNVVSDPKERAKFYVLTETALKPVDWKTARDSLRLPPSN